MCCHPMTACPKAPGGDCGASLWLEPQDGGVLHSSRRIHSAGEQSPFKHQSLWLIHSTSSSSSLIPFSIQTGHNTSVLLTVLLHYNNNNNNHDSHRVHLHCHHQIRHIRELKSYTVIFHINLKPNIYHRNKQ